MRDVLDADVLRSQKTNMLLQNLCCSLEKAKRLKELGVKQDSFFQWEVSGSRSYIRWNQYAKCGCEFMTTANLKFRYSAFTASELLALLPTAENIVIMTFDNGRAQVCLQAYESSICEGASLVDALAKLLIHLKEQGIV